MNDTMLRIYTLGRFEIYIGNEELKLNLKRSSKMWDLLKYIITNRDRQIPVDNFFDVLWEENDDCLDPIKALQNHIYRLRSELHRFSNEDTGPYPIIYSQGCYSWNKEYVCRVDCDEFEYLCKNACEMVPKDESEAIDLYYKALNLYKGEYLPELLYNEWVIPVRNHYRNIYIKCVSSISKLLRKASRHDENIDVCSVAARIEKYEENFHIWLIESYLEQGKCKDALDHYDYTTSMFYKEMGIRPSREMKNIFNAIKGPSAREDINLDQVKDILEDKIEVKGPLLCENEGFRQIYEHALRNAGRINKPVFLVLLTLSRYQSDMPGSKIFEHMMNCLKQEVISSLRKGDALTKWNESQFLILLQYLNSEEAESVVSRIKTRISKQLKANDLTLNHTIKMICKKSNSSHANIVNRIVKTI